MGETSKSKARREREGFFLLLEGRGIDIGCGADKVTDDAEEWDMYQRGHGDATDMAGVLDETYDWVYSSHTLEHLDNPGRALQSWWRILKPGGRLIVTVPHRDLYEKRERPPSKWNHEHKVFFVPDRHLFDDVLGLKQLVEESLPYGTIERLAVCDDGHTITDPEIHSDGEYQIEIFVRKT